MKIKKELEELNNYGEKALYAKILEINRNLVDLKFRASFRKLKNYKEIKGNRKKIARCWTILNQKIRTRIEQGSSKWKKKLEL